MSNFEFYVQIYLVIGAAFAAHRMFGFMRYIATRNVAPGSEEPGELFPELNGAPLWVEAIVALLAAILLVSLFAVIAATWPIGMLWSLLKRKGGAE